MWIVSDGVRGDIQLWSPIFSNANHPIRAAETIPNHSDVPVHFLVLPFLMAHGGQRNQPDQISDRIL